MSGPADDFLEQARLARRERRFDAARQHYERAIATLREAGQPLRLAHTIRHLGDVCYEAGLAALAEPHLREALAMYRREPAASALDVANAIRSLAVLTEHAGNAEEASRLWAEAHDLYASLDLTPGVSESAARLQRLRTKGE
jgi:tetratricopeptide (TPR) repeat protein